MLHWQVIQKIVKISTIDVLIQRSSCLKIVLMPFMQLATEFSMRIGLHQNHLLKFISISVQNLKCVGSSRKPQFFRVDCNIVTTIFLKEGQIHSCFNEIFFDIP